MRILILGGDGYLGWPTAIYLSHQGHDIAVADNFVRRQYDYELGAESLVPIASLQQRVKTWKDITGRKINVYVGDMTDAGFVYRMIEEFKPDTIVHYAEQRSAPYSMIDREHAVYTQVNNVVGTLNVIYAIADLNPDIHLVKLGSMGEYGTPNIDIEEGFLEVEHNGRKDILPYPKQPGSFYHLSKVHDSHNILFACKNFGLRSTDLNQGIVYGVETEQTVLHPDLATRLDYDGVFGTVLNRFCIEAVLGHPLTVYGVGEQKRGLLDIRDTVRCIEIAAENPPERGEYRVFNQFTEEFSIKELAELVAKTYPGEVKVELVEDPRTEALTHYFNARHTKLIDLGLVPHLLSDTLIQSLFGVIEKYKDRVNWDVIRTFVNWRRTRNPLYNND
ncbi:NAD-dependent epimerase/dehydratase family protein [Sulfobacillus thermosulfidooxidans]|uniref:NAD-dependent epimerase/dehydratase family protein n=1 Tax=Sulfobacillus thermosulfidooxidans TaxID=28034 RepID=UPI0006B61045|nr:NAD-dependent epimerase/dehydratase family protein [Sulfobacillus thermosulfidooxidans]OLZ08388.1 NAD-dependent dehydratase [Sulfobacillus thermosulfidooxidans]OLZ13891.1 NAD-dependent dehydratase [Sulfobacillus thermosulfidooxidans]OLZ20509.1 NAD-dependent dehydratase [Sulfobacillus thermosulfidooxidans]